MNRRRLVWQIYPSYLLVIILVIVAVSWYFSGELRSFHYQQTLNDLKARALLIKHQLQSPFGSSDQRQLNRFIKQLGEQSETRITLIRQNGTVLADSHQRAEQMDNHSQRPEILQALAGQQGSSVRFSNTLGQQLMYVAIPVHIDNRPAGTIRTALPVSDIDATLHDIHWQLLLAGLVIAVLLAPACWLLSRHLSRPLELMTAGAQRFARGDLDTPLKVTGSEETGRLAIAMNQMALDLNQRITREIEQRSESEAILGCMIEGIVAVDNNQQVLRLNRAAATLFGVSPHLCVGQPIQEVIREAELQNFIRQALNQPKPREQELILHGPQRRYLHAQGTPLTGTNGEPIGVLIVLHDRTRLRQLESVRRDFVANVSHELKTPITAIRGAVETLIDDDSADAASRRFLQIIFKQSERLNALVEDLLDLSRIEQGGTEGSWPLTPEPLAPVLENARLTCESLAAKTGIQIELSCPADLKAQIHPSLLEQAVENLLTNAIKYSDPSSKVILQGEKTEGQVMIRVRDFGCGISKDHQTRLFERFYRVDMARSRQLGGTGLGLAIVKHVVQSHHGDVAVDSAPGEGSTFTILLPQG